MDQYAQLGVKICPACGARVPSSGLFCDNCGTRMPQQQLRAEHLGENGGGPALPEPRMRKGILIGALAMMALSVLLEFVSFALPWLTEGRAAGATLYQMVFGGVSYYGMDFYAIALFILALLALVFGVLFGILGAALRRPTLIAAQCFTHLLLSLVMLVLLLSEWISGLLSPGLFLYFGAWLLNLGASILVLFARERLAGDVGRGLLWSGGFMLRSLISGLTGTYLNMYLAEELKLSGISFTLIVMAPLLLQLAAILLGGPLMDCSRTRLGKARVFDLGLLACAALAPLLFLVPASLPRGLLVVLLLLLYALVLALSTLATVSDSAYLYHALPAAGGYSGAVAVGIGALLGYLVSLLWSVLSTTAAVNREPGVYYRSLNWAGIRGCYLAMLGIPVILLLLRFLLIREKPELLRWKGQPGRQPLGEVLGTAFRNPYVLLLVGCAGLTGLEQATLNALLSEAQSVFRSNTALVSLSGIGQLLAVFSLIFFLPLAGKKGKDLLLVLGLGLSLLGHLGICLWDPVQHTTGFAVFSSLIAMGRAPVLFLLAVYLLEAAGESAKRSGVHVIGTMAALWFLADFLGVQLGSLASTWLYDGQYHHGAFWLPALLSLAALALAVLALMAHRKQRLEDLWRLPGNAARR